MRSRNSICILLLSITLFFAGSASPSYARLAPNGQSVVRDITDNVQSSDEVVAANEHGTIVIFGEPLIRGHKTVIPVLVRVTGTSVSSRTQGNSTFTLVDVPGASERVPIGQAVVPFITLKMTLPIIDNYDFNKGGVQGFAVENIRVKSSRVEGANVPRIAFRRNSFPDNDVIYAPYTGEMGNISPQFPVVVGARPYMDDLVVKVIVNLGNFNVSRQSLTLYSEVAFNMVMDNTTELQDVNGIAQPIGLNIDMDTSVVSVRSGTTLDMNFLANNPRPITEYIPEFKLYDYRGSDITFAGIYEAKRYIDSRNVLVTEYDLIFTAPDRSDPEYNTGLIPMVGEYIIRDTTGKILAFRLIPIFVRTNQ